MMKLGPTDAWLGLLFGVAIAAACSANKGDESRLQPAGGTAGLDSSATGGSSGASGSSASSGSGGTGAIQVEAGDDSQPSDGPCKSVSKVAERPAVDVIWIVDSSCSMADEIDKIRTNINQSFVPTISGSIIDWQVIMLAERGTTDQQVCVDPPLAGPGCADNPPRFHHVACTVGSTDSFTIASGSYGGALFPFCVQGPGWGSYLRYNAFKVFVEVTDDEMDTAPPFGMSAAAFDSWLGNNATPPGMFGTGSTRKYVFHSIVGLDPQNPSQACVALGPDGGIVNTAVAPGLEYQKLSQVTGGLVRSICESDWSDIFDTIAQGIISRLSCEYPVTEGPDAGAIDPSKVNVKYTPGGADGGGDGGSTEDILQDPHEACDAGADGWQWTADQTKILLCGPTCDRVKADLDGRIDIEIGCETKVTPPPT
jgi:hypothetical protein